jgi:hypothetical protein
MFIQEKFLLPTHSKKSSSSAASEKFGATFYVNISYRVQPKDQHLNQSLCFALHKI